MMSVENEVRYEYLRPGQIVEAREAFPVAYLALGSIEWHGQQNPVGLDGLKAHALCVRAARISGGLVFPAVMWGEHRELHLMDSNPSYVEGMAQRYHLPVGNFAPGYMNRTVEEQTKFYCDLIWHILYEIRSLGFKAIVVVCGHYPLTRYCLLVAENFSRRYEIPVWYGIESDPVSHLGYRGDHGAQWETSLMMAAAPETVDLSVLPDDRNVPVFGTGGWGDARDATAEFGKKASQDIAEALAEIAKGLLEKTGAR